MKTAMELALARIEMLNGMKPDSIHWEMFKNDCMEKEKEQIMDAFKYGWNWNFDSETYYNQAYNQKEETLEDWKSKFTHHCAIKNNQNK